MLSSHPSAASGSRLDYDINLRITHPPVGNHARSGIRLSDEGRNVAPFAKNIVVVVGTEVLEDRMKLYPYLSPWHPRRDAWRCRRVILAYPLFHYAGTFRGWPYLAQHIGRDEQIVVHACYSVFHHLLTLAGAEQDADQVSLMHSVS